MGHDLGLADEPQVIHKFVSSAVTTRLRVEEFPTCLEEEGLYLDFTFKICKQIRGYALINQNLFSPRVPPIFDAGRSWTLGFWTYIGCIKDPT